MAESVSSSLAGERAAVLSVWATIFIANYITAMGQLEDPDKWTIAFVLLASFFSAGFLTFVFVRIYVMREVSVVVDWMIGQRPLDRAVVRGLLILVAAAIVATVAFGVLWPT